MQILPVHVHSNFTLLKGTIPIPELVRSAKDFGYGAIALTDSNAMYGVIPFVKSAIEIGIRPIIGTQITFSENPEDYIILLAKNNEGYADMCQEITRRNLFDVYTADHLISNASPNIFYITPSIEYYRNFETIQDVFFEVFVHNGLPENLEQLRELRCIPSIPVYFLKNEDYAFHRIVSAIRERKTLGTITHHSLVDEGFYLRGADFWQEFLLPETWLQNLRFIEEHCTVDLRLGEYKFPHYKVNGDQTSFGFLWQLCQKGLRGRYPEVTEKIQDRLDEELSVIQDLNFVDYFLIVWDIVMEANRRGMVHIGRGSAANSLVAYCLGLTEVDPIQYDLYFERFLNRSRKSPPDVDLDFSWKERDEIIKYVFERYGYERVAMISTTVTFRARSAFRETAKVFGFSDEQISKYSKFIPWTSAANLERLPEKFPEARMLKFDDEIWQVVLKQAARLAGFPHHLSIHPSGLVIAPDKITHYTALEYAKNKGLGLIITQPDMYSIEDIGLVKIDLLSQRSLGVLRLSLNQIKKNDY
ncbi:MAG: PHP domain-containing protein [Ignavibacteria bacterium]|nr:PHP domain-containing protein [Ignavibacteria bacterium]